MEGGDDGLERVTDHEEPKGVAVKGREFYGMEKKTSLQKHVLQLSTFLPFRISARERCDFPGGESCCIQGCGASLVHT